jgi:hypothetical protein
MPVLCSFTDLHTISLLLYKSPQEYWFKNYPYVYNKSMFSSSFSEDTFYQSLFSAFCAEHDVTLTSCDILLTGFLEAPQLGIPVTLTKSLYEVFSGVKGNYPVLINNTSIFTPDFCLSNSILKPRNKAVDFAEVDEDNFYANLEIYPQITANDISTQVDLDSNIVALMDEKSVFSKNMPLVFCGSRFSRMTLYPELDYLLMLGVIRDAGMHEVYQDTMNSLILTTLLGIHDPSAVVAPDLLRVATVVSSPGAIECMTKPDEGTSQLVRVEKGKTAVIPVIKGERVGVMIKSHHLGTLERNVIGGGLGLILDARSEKRILARDINIFSSSLKSFKGSLIREA